jgi:hypothetical protein
LGIFKTGTKVLTLCLPCLIIMLAFMLTQRYSKAVVILKHIGAPAMEIYIKFVEEIIGNGQSSFIRQVLKVARQHEVGSFQLHRFFDDKKQSKVKAKAKIW